MKIRYAVGLLSLGFALVTACGSDKVDIDATNDIETDACVPDCAIGNCGPDGCGGVCGECGDGFFCDEGWCESLPDVPECWDKECGDDGYGGSCGQCPEGEVCDMYKCFCAPNCKDKECGDDGCGGSCGTCSAECICNGLGGCEGPGCTGPGCDNKDCGDDGNGGSCGECGQGDWCNPDGVCELATCSIITDCVEVCPGSAPACQEACLSAAPVEVREAFEALVDCTESLVFPYDGPCGDFAEDEDVWQDCWDDWYSQCDEEYYACWPPGEGTCTDLYSCLVSCPEDDAEQTCVNDCFGDASLDALDIWDTFIDCLDENGYFDCNEQFICLDEAWDLCLEEFNDCICDPECPEVPCEFEVCDGLDNDCDGATDEGFADYDIDGQANCVDEDDDDDGDPDTADCEPLNGNVYNGALEACDCIDNNCNGKTDEGFMDADGNGLADCCEPSDTDMDGDPDEMDCAPWDPQVFHGAIEECDGVDNNCDMQVDEGCDCAPEEICDGYDNDCDTAVDEPPCDVECDCGLDYPAPVCGSDGITYLTSCFAECVGVTEYLKGECPGCKDLCTDEELNSGPVCSNVQADPEGCGTTFDSFCDLKCQVGSDDCVSFDDCPEVFAPGTCKCE